MNGRALLHDYLSERKLKPAEFSRETLGKIGEPELSRWLSGPGRPSMDKAFELEELTRGRVPAKAWRNGRSRKRRQ